MSVTRLGCFYDDGARRGSYVYLLLCAADDTAAPVLVKVGVSDCPTRRLYELRPECPAPPARFAFAELGSRSRALDVARALAYLFEPWRTAGGWMAVPPEEQPLFKAAWRFVLQRPAWQSVAVPALLEAGGVRL